MYNNLIIEYLFLSNIIQSNIIEDYSILFNNKGIILTNLINKELYFCEKELISFIYFYSFFVKNEIYYNNNFDFYYESNIHISKLIKYKKFTLINNNYIINNVNTEINDLYNLTILKKKKNYFFNNNRFINFCINLNNIKIFKENQIFLTFLYYLKLDFKFLNNIFNYIFNIDLNLLNKDKNLNNFKLVETIVSTNLKNYKNIMKNLSRPLNPLKIYNDKLIINLYSNSKNIYLSSNINNLYLNENLTKKHLNIFYSLYTADYNLKLLLNFLKSDFYREYHLKLPINYVNSCIFNNGYKKYSGSSIDFFLSNLTYDRILFNQKEKNFIKSLKFIKNKFGFNPLIYNYKFSNKFNYFAFKKYNLNLNQLIEYNIDFFDITLKRFLNSGVNITNTGRPDNSETFGNEVYYRTYNRQKNFTLFKYESKRTLRKVNPFTTTNHKWAPKKRFRYTDKFSSFYKKMHHNPFLMFDKFKFFDYSRYLNKTSILSLIQFTDIDMFYKQTDTFFIKGNGLAQQYNHISLLNNMLNFFKKNLYLEDDENYYEYISKFLNERFHLNIIYEKTNFERSLNLNYLLSEQKKPNVTLYQYLNNLLFGFIYENKITSHIEFKNNYNSNNFIVDHILYRINNLFFNFNLKKNINSNNIVFTNSKFYHKKITYNCLYLHTKKKKIPLNFEIWPIISKYTNRIYTDFGWSFNTTFFLKRKNYYYKELPNLIKFIKLNKNQKFSYNFLNYIPFFNIFKFQFLKKSLNFTKRNDLIYLEPKLFFKNLPIFHSYDKYKYIEKTGSILIKFKNLFYNTNTQKIDQSVYDINPFKNKSINYITDSFNEKYPTLEWNNKIFFNIINRKLFFKHICMFSNLSNKKILYYFYEYTRIVFFEEKLKNIIFNHNIFKNKNFKNLTDLYILKLNSLKIKNLKEYLYSPDYFKIQSNININNIKFNFSKYSYFTILKFNTFLFKIESYTRYTSFNIIQYCFGWYTLKQCFLHNYINIIYYYNLKPNLQNIYNHDIKLKNIVQPHVTYFNFTISILKNLINSLLHKKKCSIYVEYFENSKYLTDNNNLIIYGPAIGCRNISSFLFSYLNAYIPKIENLIRNGFIYDFNENSKEYFVRKKINGNNIIFTENIYKQKKNDNNKNFIIDSIFNFFSFIFIINYNSLSFFKFFKDFYLTYTLNNNINNIINLFISKYIYIYDINLIKKKNYTNFKLYKNKLYTEAGLYTVDITKNDYTDDKYYLLYHRKRLENEILYNSEHVSKFLHSNIEYFYKDDNYNIIKFLNNIKDYYFFINYKFIYKISDYFNLISHFNNFEYIPNYVHYCKNSNLNLKYNFQTFTNVYKFAYDIFKIGFGFQNKIITNNYPQDLYKIKLYPFFLEPDTYAFKYIKQYYKYRSQENIFLKYFIKTKKIRKGKLNIYGYYAWRRPLKSYRRHHRLYGTYNVFSSRLRDKYYYDIDKFEIFFGTKKSYLKSKVNLKKFFRISSVFQYYGDTRLPKNKTKNFMKINFIFQIFNYNSYFQNKRYFFENKNKLQYKQFFNHKTSSDYLNNLIQYNKKIHLFTNTKYYRLRRIKYRTSHPLTKEDIIKINYNKIPYSLISLYNPIKIWQINLSSKLFPYFYSKNLNKNMYIIETTRLKTIDSVYRILKTYIEKKPTSFFYRFFYGNRYFTKNFNNIQKTDKLQLEITKKTIDFFCNPLKIKFKNKNRTNFKIKQSFMFIQYSLLPKLNLKLNLFPLNSYLLNTQKFNFNNLTLYNLDLNNNIIEFKKKRQSILLKKKYYINSINNIFLQEQNYLNYKYNLKINNFLFSLKLNRELNNLISYIAIPYHLNMILSYNHFDNNINILTQYLKFFKYCINKNLYINIPYISNYNYKQINLIKYTKIFKLNKNLIFYFKNIKFLLLKDFFIINNLKKMKNLNFFNFNFNNYKDNMFFFIFENKKKFLNNYIKIYNFNILFYDKTYFFESKNKFYHKIKYLFFIQNITNLNDYYFNQVTFQGNLQIFEPRPHGNINKIHDYSMRIPEVLYSKKHLKFFYNLYITHYCKYFRSLIVFNNMNNKLKNYSQYLKINFLLNKKKFFNFYYTTNIKSFMEEFYNSRGRKITIIDNEYFIEVSPDKYYYKIDINFVADFIKQKYKYYYYRYYNLNNKKEFRFDAASLAPFKFYLKTFYYNKLISNIHVFNNLYHKKPIYLINNSIINNFLIYKKIIYLEKNILLLNEIKQKKYIFFSEIYDLKKFLKNNKHKINNLYIFNPYDYYIFRYKRSFSSIQKVFYNNNKNLELKFNIFKNFNFFKDYKETYDFCKKYVNSFFSYKKKKKGHIDLMYKHIKAFKISFNINFYENISNFNKKKIEELSFFGFLLKNNILLGTLEYNKSIILAYNLKIENIINNNNESQLYNYQKLKNTIFSLKNKYIWLIFFYFNLYFYFIYDYSFFYFIFFPQKFIKIYSFLDYPILFLIDYNYFYKDLFFTIYSYIIYFLIYFYNWFCISGEGLLNLEDWIFLQHHKINWELLKNKYNLYKNDVYGYNIQEMYISRFCFFWFFSGYFLIYYYIIFKNIFKFFIILNKIKKQYIKFKYYFIFYLNHFFENNENFYKNLKSYIYYEKYEKYVNNFLNDKEKKNYTITFFYKSEHSIKYYKSSYQGKIRLPYFIDEASLKRLNKMRIISVFTPHLFFFKKNLKKIRKTFAFLNKSFVMFTNNRFIEMNHILFKGNIKKILYIYKLGTEIIYDVITNSDKLDMIYNKNLKNNTNENDIDEISKEIFKIDFIEMIFLNNQLKTYILMPLSEDHNYIYIPKNIYFSNIKYRLKYLNISYIYSFLFILFLDIFFNYDNKFFYNTTNPKFNNFLLFFNENSWIKTFTFFF
jgi:hypothetical protein